MNQSGAGEASRFPRLVHFHRQAQDTAYGYAYESEVIWIGEKRPFPPQKPRLTHHHRHQQHPISRLEVCYWIPIGQNAINGDAEAVAAGFPPMSNPSAAEVQLLLDNATAEAGEADAADRVHDKSQAAVAGLRVSVNKMIDDIMAELRFRLRDEDKAGQRRIMRTYGATFNYLEGEPVDTDDQGVGVVVA